MNMPFRFLRRPAEVLTHWRFYRRHRVLRLREAALVLVCGTLAVIAETGGMAMLLPILSFVEHRGDVEVFARSSSLSSAVVAAYAWVGMPISLVTLSAAALLFIVLRQVIVYFSAIEIERIKWNIGRRLSIRVFETILGSVAPSIRAYKAGEFGVVAEFECQATAAIARVYGTMWMQIISFASYGAVLVWTAPLASLLAGIILGCSMIALRVLLRKTKRLSQVAQDMRRLYANFLNERFRAWKIIKLGNSLPVERRKADEIQAKVVSNQIHLLRVSGVLTLVFIPVMSAFLLGILYVFVEVLKLDVSTVILFVLVMIRLTPVSQALQKQLSLLATFAPSFERIDAVLKTGIKEREELDRGRPLGNLVHRITFEGVSFTYRDRETSALSDISLHIPAGRMTALVGPSGSGKSTLVDLIPRIIDPDRGRILFDGVPASEISLRSLRQSIAYVSQEPFIFDATFAENIQYPLSEVSEQKIEEAARLANAAEFIEASPQRYKTRLGDAGATLSGGQKQRVALARAFLSKAQILILDEPTSALDYESEAAIQAAIDTLVRERGLTVIVIAHRLSTVRNASFVVQLRDGRVVRTGSAPEVLGSLSREPTAHGLRELDFVRP